MSVSTRAADAKQQRMMNGRREGGEGVGVSDERAEGDEKRWRNNGRRPY